jgi:hypothetical protein
MINAESSEAMQYPDNSHINSYCFKYKKIYENNLFFNPEKGFGLEEFDEFFDKYRITACTAIIKKGEMYKDEILIKKGDFKLIYYPNFPSFISYRDRKNEHETWDLKNCKQIDITCHYEMIPIYPYITIPDEKTVYNVDYFKKEFLILDRENPKIEMDLEFGEMGENISIGEFLKIINERD